MKVLIASDKFKGTLTAKEVADLISEGLSDHECVLKPVADGGEGTSDILGPVSYTHLTLPTIYSV